MSAILTGKIQRPPDWDVTIAMVRACLEHAKAVGRLVPPDLSDEADWRRRHGDLERDLASGGQARPLREKPTGWLLAEVTDAFALEVHRPVQPGTPKNALPALPAYVARHHDVELEQVVTAAVGGRSRIAVLVGGSSTGKTRACLEALDILRHRDQQWKLWHPISPGRPEAVLEGLSRIGAHTVVWLNDMQSYLLTPGSDEGERIAAVLRKLLRTPKCKPVLVEQQPGCWERRAAPGRLSRS